MKTKPLLPSRLIIFSGILLTSILLYFPSLSNQFALDDYSMILQNDKVTSFQTLAESYGTISKSFDQNSGIFRPASYVFRAALYSLFKTHAPYYHAVNIFLFAVLCFYIYQLLCRIDGRKKIAAYTTLLFLVHPIHSYPVNHICGHEILLFGLFTVLSIKYFFDYMTTLKVRDLALSLIFYVGALFLREASIVIPLMIMGTGYLYFRQSWKKTLKICFPFILITIFFMVYRFLFFPKTSMQIVSTISAGGIFAHLLSSIELFGWYLIKIIWPFDIVFMKNLSAVPSKELFVYGLTAIVVIAGFILKIRKSAITAQLLGLWFLLGAGLAMVQTSIYYSAMSNILEPHWLFVMDVGLFWLMVHAFLKWSSSWPEFFKKIVFITIILFYSLLTILSIPQFKDTPTYCAFWLKRVPSNPYAYVYLMNFYKYHHNDEQVVANAQKVLSWGHNEKIYHELANAYEHLGQDNKVFETVSKAVANFPQSSNFNNWMGTLLFKNANYKKAIEFYKKSIIADPKNSQGIKNLADAYLKIEAFSDSIEILSHALSLENNHDQKKVILAKRIICFSKLKNKDQLDEDLKAFFKLNPTKDDMNGFVYLSQLLDEPTLGGDFYLMAGDIENKKGNQQKAHSFWETGLSIAPNHVELKKRLREKSP